MKRIYYLMITLLVLTFASSPVMAQHSRKGNNEIKKEMKKEVRKKRREIEAAQQEYLYEKGMQALKEQSFIVRVDQLIYPKGRTQFVTARTNFIYMNQGNAVIQIATSNFYLGQNGVGGITVEGTPSNITMKSDKKGYTFYEFTVQGIAVSANVTIQVVPGSNRVDVTIYPNFSNNKLTMTGSLVPFDSSLIYQGKTL